MSKSILQQFYDGEIYPSEQIVPQSQEYKEVSQELSEEKSYFRKGLSEDDLKRFEKMDGMYHSVRQLDCTEHFIYGFKLAVKLIFAGMEKEDNNANTDE